MGRPGGFGGGWPQGMEPPEGFDPGKRGEPPQGMELPPDFQGFRPDGGADLPEEMGPGERTHPLEGGFPGLGAGTGGGSGSTDFMLTETARSFSGICDSDQSGKTRVAFTVEGTRRVGRNTVLETVTAITPSLELDPALVQVTVTDDPSEDYSASCLLSDGLEAVNTLLPTEDGSYILTVAVVGASEDRTGATQIPFTVGALPFLDLREGDAGYDAARALWRSGVLRGTGEHTFSPNAPVTRAQAVTALGRLAGAEEAESGAFSDVDPGAWYAGYVGWASERGLVEGDGQGRFLPDAIVTAEQLGLMLERYSEDYVNSTEFSGPLTRLQMAQMLADVLP